MLQVMLRMLLLGWLIFSCQLVEKLEGVAGDAEDVAAGVAHFLLPADRKMSLVRLRVLQVMLRMLPRCCGGSFSVASCSKNEPGEAEGVAGDAFQNSMPRSKTRA